MVVCMSDSMTLSNVRANMADEASSVEATDRIERHRVYLLLLARTQLGRQLQRRVSASDVVQDTILLAWSRVGQFRGGSEGQFTGWLRSILSRTIQRAVEREMLTERRDLRRETALSQVLQENEESHICVERALMSDETSPSHAASRNEVSIEIANRIARLPHEYQYLIVQRSLCGRPFDVIAAEMGKTSGAVRAMWLRALHKLREMAERQSSH